jgi:hypothetical protein
MPWKLIPFDNLIPFDELKCKNVLEIGLAWVVMQGCSLLRHNPILDRFERLPVKMTTERMKLFGTETTIWQMDAEEMKFSDSTFDFV